MRRLLILITLTASTLLGQLDLPLVEFPQALKAHLELTNEQTAAIVQMNRQFGADEAARTGRLLHLRREINRGVAWRTLDREELEALSQEMAEIPREIEVHRNKAREGIQALLTPAQKAKITSLRQTMLSEPLACDAANQNLLALPPAVEGRTATVLRRYLGACGVLNARPLTVASRFSR